MSLQRNTNTGVQHRKTISEFPSEGKPTQCQKCFRFDFLGGRNFFISFQFPATTRREESRLRQYLFRRKKKIGKENKKTRSLKLKMRSFTQSLYCLGTRALRYHQACLDSLLIAELSLIQQSMNGQQTITKPKPKMTICTHSQVLRYPQT